MKKLYLASALATVLTLSSNAMAIDSTGCGLGSMAWRGQSGTAPQILAVTTNGSFGTQTFGISSGTSGCDQNGRITGGTQRMVLNFLENNMEQYALDASRGEGYCTDTRRCGTGRCKRWLQIHHVAIYINDEFLIDSTGGNNSVQIRKHWGKNGSEWEWVCFGRPTN